MWISIGKNWNFFIFFFEKGYNIWWEKDKNVCQLKALVNQKPHERYIYPFDYLGINKMTSAKGHYIRSQIYRQIPEL